MQIGFSDCPNFTENKQHVIVPALNRDSCPIETVFISLPFYALRAVTLHRFRYRNSLMKHIRRVST